MPKDTQKQIKLTELRQQLDAAVRSEDYERAAKLRDEINQLE
jgi:protein-arginine kinase activator protein McsA